MYVHYMFIKSFALILMIRAYCSWKSKIKYLNILEYFLKINQKKYLQNSKVQVL